MNSKIVKKLRKYSRQPFMEYVRMMEQWPYRARLRFAWHILKPRGAKWQKIGRFMRRR